MAEKIPDDVMKKMDDFEKTMGLLRSQIGPLEDLLELCF